MAWVQDLDTSTENGVFTDLFVPIYQVHDLGFESTLRAWLRISTRFLSSRCSFLEIHLRLVTTLRNFLSPLHETPIWGLESIFKAKAS